MYKHILSLSLEVGLNKLFIILIGFFCATAYAEKPQVLTSIQPIHSITSQIMAGVGSPKLLLPPGSSPHFFQLKPSDAKAIHQAQLIIWVGPELENFLEKTIVRINPKAYSLALTQVKGIELIPFTHDHHDHGNDHHHDHGDEHHHDHHHGALDPHIWLSPSYAKLIAEAIANALIEMDPEHENLYRLNLTRTIHSLDRLSEELKAQLSPFKDQAFMVYHDGYQYFTEYFHLNSLGPLTQNPHIPLSAKAYKEIKQKLETEQVVCVFGEPDTNPNVLSSMVKGTQAKTGILDPLGMHLEPSQHAYEKMMRQLASSLKDCLQNSE